MNKTKRGFRYAIFDLFGHEVGRQSLDEAMSTSDKALKAMYDKLNSIDVTAHYREALQSQARQAERNADKYKNALSQIEA